MSDSLGAITSGQTPAGVYAWRSGMRAARVQRRIAPLDWKLGHLDGTAISGKADLLLAVGAALAFPPYYGQNWDALEECLTDLSWLPAQGYLLLYDQADQLARRAPDIWGIGCATMQHAASIWAARSTPFYVLARGDAAALADLPRL